MDTKRPILVFILTLFFAICVASGILLQTPKYDPEIIELGKDLGNVLKIVDENYVDSIDRKQVFLKAAGTIVERDRYSSFMQEENLTEFEENIEGDFVGIGIEYRRMIDCVIVSDILPKGPSSGKLRFDDKIYFIDKKPVEEMDGEEIAKAMRGAVGSKVMIGFRRAGTEELIEIELERKSVEKSPIRFVHIIDEKDGIGYIGIEMFNKHLSKEFRKAYLNLLNGSSKMQVLILDMRGNPGGNFYSVIDFCDLFLKSGLIVATIGNEEGQRHKEVLYNAKTDVELPNVPIYIMLDRESASAAELSAGCLRDHKLAIIFGEKSFGKGEAQSTIPMHSKVMGDYGIKLTTSKFYVKSGFESSPKKSISGEGIIPNIAYDFGAQDTYIKRLRLYNRAWGVWNQELAFGNTLLEAKNKCEYFANLANNDPGLEKLLSIIKIERAGK